VAFVLGGRQGDGVSVTLEEDDEVILGLDGEGRPDPDYAKSLGIVSASAGLRSLAFAIDAAIVLLHTLPLSLGTLPLWLGVVLARPTPGPVAIVTSDAFITGLIFYAIGQGAVSIFVLVQVILHGIRGITVGKAIVGIRSVNVATFAKPGFWRIVLRALVFWCALAIIPILGAVPFLLSPLWDREKRGRGWLDRIGRNWLIDARRGLDPFDAKALRHARKRLTATEVAQAPAMPSLATGAAGAVASFVPASRSRSGVIAPRSFGAGHGGDAESESWQPPEVGTPEPPAARVQAAATSANGVILLFDDGVRLAVSGTGLVGRGPEPRPGERVEQLIPIADESLLISKTHLGFGVDDGGFWVVDRGSVNGTSVVSPEGASVDLVPWEQQHVGWNSVVEVGGRSFTVLAGTESNGRTK
jgi:hypothetical protein